LSASKPITVVKKAGKGLLYFCYVTLAVLLLFEVIYRYQWIDFYASELDGLNKKRDLEQPKKGKTILVFGDSFTATNNGYVDLLRDSLNDYTIINSAVPGSGIIQASLMANRRIERFDPDVMIYQIYLGNDLMDISHPTDGNVSLTRKGYWWLSDKFRGLSYINFRLSGVKYKVYDDAGVAKQPKQFEEFSEANYSQRQKLYFNAEPQLLENTAFLLNNRSDDFNELTDRLDGMIEQLKPECKVIIVIIPHCAQINETYKSRMQKIGAEFNGNKILQANYPFLWDLRGHLEQFPNVEVVSPIATLREADEKQPVYYANDPHLNDFGQETLGQFIYQGLKKRINP
jgi:hypothetical protein